MPLVDPILKAALLCPQCHGQLTEDEAGNRLVCSHCQLAFRVEGGLPIMLVEDAEKLGDAVAQEN